MAHLDLRRGDAPVDGGEVVGGQYGLKPAPLRLVLGHSHKVLGADAPAGRRKLAVPFKNIYSSIKCTIL